MPTIEPAKCVRFGQPLPERSGFCVACGYQNEAALIERRARVVGHADERIGWMRWLRELTRGIGILRRF